MTDGPGPGTTEGRMTEEEPKKYYFRDFFGRVIGPFPSKEVALQAAKEFDAYLCEALWKKFHGGFMYRPIWRLAC